MILLPYSIEAVTTPTGEPIDTSDIKAHSRIDTSEQDTLIGALITAARQHVEMITHRSLVSIQWRLRMDRFPTWSINLPRPPVTALATTDVTYIATSEAPDADVYTTMPSSDWILDQYSEPARLTPAYGVSWPDTKQRVNAVRVTFTSGYTTDTIPDALLQSIKLLAGHWYENREGVMTGSVAREMDFTINALAGSYRFGDIH